MEWKMFRSLSYNVRGLAFLLAYTTIGATLNYLRAKQADLPETSSFIFLTIGWMVISLFYLFIYLALIYSIRHWDWTLDEWGFNLRGRAWISIGVSMLSLAFAWSIISPPNLEVNLRDVFSQLSTPLLLFQGYARTAEELLYRGFALILFKRIFRRLGYSSVIAVLLSSLMFSFVHTHRLGDIPQLFIFTSIPLASFTLWTQSISLAVVLHSIAGGGHIGGLFGMLFFFLVAIYNEWQKHCSCQML
jgi:hypothetical protein